MSLETNSEQLESNKSPADWEVPSPPAPTSDQPDLETRKDPAYTDGHAPNQVFHFQRWGFSYGTDDKGHAAALTLSLAILALILVIVVIGALLSEREWLADILKVLGSAFLIVAGIAVGKSAGKSE
ncbi:hypothetical protein [Rhizobium rhizogenes]|uniref:hypothetical protein n=1 Tax=Rhizobium rhizogenes TaxID=359 RepID=UPI0015718D1A|nr:hypothetical protein [Rhizobium rhizogenes]NTF63424.1 hypothetical protein [Rhizobium rhizogenes]NTG94756.1 hypothetical protein [Rhizobium rhizogenes]